VTLTEFLLARIAEDEAAASAAFETSRRWVVQMGVGVAGMSGSAVLAECKAKRQIIAFHDQWPVLVQQEPVLEPVASVSDMSFRMTQQINWLTNREYVARFGEDPPTGPMLRALAAVYADHPDYDSEWALT
jgi:hypothetical protein